MGPWAGARDIYSRESKATAFKHRLLFGIVQSHLLKATN